MFNSITVVGYAGADPEMRYLPSGMPITTFPLYCTYKYGEGKEDTDKFRVTFFSTRAENVNQFVRSGQLVAVEGRFRSRVYTGQDNVQRTLLEIIGNDLRTAGGRQTEEKEDEAMSDPPF